MGGKLDKGDIAGIPGVCLEVKNTTALRLGTWMKEVTQEAKNANATIKAVVFNRRNHSILQAYVLMELADFVELLDTSTIVSDCEAQTSAPRKEKKP